ncbi:MAG: NAD(+) synthase, partial [Parachlamydiaceae bacterium]
TLNTGNKSELAMGYCTLYGDMCGGLGVINDLSKRQVYALAQWINRSKEIIPVSTLQKPPSAELRPNQFDSDSLPEYDIVDNVVEAYVEHQFSKEEIAEKFGYPVAIVENLIKKIHQNEYKRRQSAPGLRVSDKAFSAGRSFPIVQGFIR